MYSGNGGNPTPEVSPYLELSRQHWAQLRADTTMTLSAAKLGRLTGLGDRADLAEVEHIYLPLCRLLHVHIGAAANLHRGTSAFLGEHHTRVPFVIGVAGSVAVGKSTTARIIQNLLRSWPEHPRVELVTTDGFLLPNHELSARGILARKGFPESYDRRALLRFMTQIKAGQPKVWAPVYSHLHYDVLADHQQLVQRADVLLVEGLNVLQPPRPDRRGRAGLAVSDFFDFSIYVDAKESDARRWYVDRFLRLRATAFADEQSYFHRYAQLSDSQAMAVADRIWSETNAPNLRENIQPTRSRATLVLTKGPDHSVTRIRLRKN